MVGVEGPPFIHLCGSRLLTKPRTGTTCSLVLLMPPACVGALPGGRIRSLLCLCWLVISSVTVLCLSFRLVAGHRRRVGKESGRESQKPDSNRKDHAVPRGRRLGVPAQLSGMLPRDGELISRRNLGCELAADTDTMLVRVDANETDASRAKPVGFAVASVKGNPTRTFVLEAACTVPYIAPYPSDFPWQQDNREQIVSRSYTRILTRQS